MLRNLQPPPRVKLLATARLTLRRAATTPPRWRSCLKSQHRLNRSKCVYPDRCSPLTAHRCLYCKNTLQLTLAAHSQGPRFPMDPPVVFMGD